jgi:glutaconate CoA-transferase subunit A
MVNAAAYEIVRQQKKNLYFITDSENEPAEILIGAGYVRKLLHAYTWIGLIGSGLSFRRAVEKGIPRSVEVEEYSNLAVGMMYMAGALNVPYMPLRSLVGSDLPKCNPNIKIVEDPYGGKPIALVPALKPDVAFIHVQKADKMGNAQIWGMLANDVNLARAAKHVVITCEEIVPTSELRKIPNMTAIPFYCVDAVVEVPFCSHPAGVAGYYWMDIPFRRTFLNANKSDEGFRKWLKEWVLDIDNHNDYLKKLGEARLDKLRGLEFDNYRIPTINCQR